ncbi:MAG: ATP-binding protein [Acidobacteriia bacterium]|nr:ATP-binding protein [Terriglobia bacterium]
MNQVDSLPRRLDLGRDLNSRSVFLFGPRQTGKTTWMHQRFPSSPLFDLLHGEVFLRLSREPGRLRQELATVNPASGPVLIDEIQKLPSLLDEVHGLIEDRGFRFVLAASSPVKLRRGGVNLLGGRARTRRMFPFVSAEVPGWDLQRAINVGGIPSIYFSDEPMEDLRAYCGNYLRLEIQAEGLVRGIEPFSRFLAAAGASYAQPIVFERLGSDAAVPARTVREYFQVIEDTLLGTLLRPFAPHKAHRKPVSRAKLFFFDVGIANALASMGEILPGSPMFGPALEQLVFCELSAWLAYTRDQRTLAYWRTEDGSEVDFVIGDEVAIEVKATSSVTRRDLTGLRRLAAETTLKRQFLVCRESVPRLIGPIQILPIKDFLERLWDGELLA